MNPQTDTTFKDYLITSPKRIFFGIVVIVFSLNGLLKYIAKSNPDSTISNYLAKVATLPDYLYNQAPGGRNFLFTVLVHWLIVSIFVFFTLLTITSLRHGSLSFLFSGSVGFVGGLSSITIITLLLYAIFWLFVFISWIFIVIRSIVLYILSWILWPPLLYVIGVIAVGAIFFLIIKHFASIIKILIELLRYVLSSLPKIILFTALLAAAVWLLWLIYGLIYPILLTVIAFLREYIAPIIAWIVAALFTVILAVIAIGLLVAIVWALGDLFIGQFSSSKFCGRSTYEAFDACFGAGAAISLVLLVCASNATYHDILKFSWSETSFFLPQSDPVNFAYGLMPSGAFNNLVSLFQWSSIPVFDATNLLLFLFLMNSSLLMGLMSGIVIEPLRGLVSVERVPAIFKLFVYAVILPFSIIAVDSTASSE